MTTPAKAQKAAAGERLDQLCKAVEGEVFEILAVALDMLPFSKSRAQLEASARNLKRAVETARPDEDEEEGDQR